MTISNATRSFSFSVSNGERTFVAPREEVNPEPLDAFDPSKYILREPIEERPKPSNAPANKMKLDGVRFEVRGNMVHFKQDKNLEMIQDIYMRVIHDELHFSVDGNKWLPFGDFFMLDCNLDFPLDDASGPKELAITFDISTLV